MRGWNSPSRILESEFRTEARSDLQAVHAGRVFDDTAIRRDGSGPGDQFETYFTLIVDLPVTEAPLAISQSSALGVQLSGSPRNVLVVEDNAVNRHVATSLLKRFGCEVLTANDGLEAVEAASSVEFDLILMDCHMPGMDGFEAMRRIRQLSHPNASTMIVALSAGVLQEEVQKCRIAGMNHFLAKPVRSADLASLLHGLSEMEKGQPFGWPSPQSI